MNDTADSRGRKMGQFGKNDLADMDDGLDRKNHEGTGPEAPAVYVVRTSARLDGTDKMERRSTSREAIFRSMESGGERVGKGEPEGGVDLGRIPEGVRASVAYRVGEYDARRLRSQREIIRDVMLSAAECETWLTLGELRALTRYGEASISAQLRHLRKEENGGYDVIKRHREGASPERPGSDGRGECVWEYRMTRGIGVNTAAAEAQLEAVGA
jgi:hypothetical protein